MNYDPRRCAFFGDDLSRVYLVIQFRMYSYLIQWWSVPSESGFTLNDNRSHVQLEPSHHVKDKLKHSTVFLRRTVELQKIADKCTLQP